MFGFCPEAIKDALSSTPLVAPPWGGAPVSAGEPFIDSLVASNNVEEVPVSSQASQSLLDDVVVTPHVVEDVSASSQAPSEASGGDMDLDSLDLRDNELNEVASEPMVLSGEPLFDARWF